MPNAWWRSRRDRSARREPPVHLVEKDHPRLFDLLRAIARLTETEMVDEVVLQWGESFAVSEERSGGWSSKRRRRLYLDCGSSCGLTLGELAALFLLEEGARRGAKLEEESSTGPVRRSDGRCASHEHSRPAPGGAELRVGNRVTRRG